MPTTIRRRLPPLALVAATLTFAGALGGCDDAPTTAVVDNAFLPRADAGALAPRGTTVFKVWWVATLFPSPVEPGAASETERTVPGNDYAYALLAPDWSPADGVAPARLIVARSVEKLSVSAHDTLRIVVSNDTFIGDCAAGKALAPAEARRIAERIFPGDLARIATGPATCGASTTDGGDADAGTDAADAHD